MGFILCLMLAETGGAAGARYLTEGGRNDIGPAGRWVYFDRVVSMVPYEIEIFRIRSGGGGEECLTCGLSRLPKVIGQPLVHPSGKGMLFQGLTHTAPGKRRSPYYHPSWGFHNDFYWLDFSSQTTHVILDCSAQFGNGFGSACLHPHFSPAGDKLLFSSRARKGLIQNPWEWWSPATASFNISTARSGNVRLAVPRVRNAFYETHQLFGNGSFYYSYGPGEYPQGAYLFRPGRSPKPVYAPGNGDWVEHIHKTRLGKVLLNTSNGSWNPRDGVGQLKMELYQWKFGNVLEPLTALGYVTSDFSCHTRFCVVQLADLSNPDDQPKLYVITLE